VFGVRGSGVVGVKGGIGGMSHEVTDVDLVHSVKCE